MSTAAFASRGLKPLDHLLRRGLHLPASVFRGSPWNSLPRIRGHAQPASVVRVGSFPSSSLCHVSAVVTNPLCESAASLLSTASKLGPCRQPVVLQLLSSAVLCCTPASSLSSSSSASHRRGRRLAPSSEPPRFDLLQAPLFSKSRVILLHVVVIGLVTHDILITKEYPSNMLISFPLSFYFTFPVVGDRSLLDR